MPCGRSVRASSSARTTTRPSARRSGTRRQAWSTCRLTPIRTSSPAPARWRSKSSRRTRRSKSSSVRLAAVGWRAALPSPPAIAPRHGASKRRRPARSPGASPPDVSWRSTSSHHWPMDWWGISTRRRSRSTWCGSTSRALRRSRKHRSRSTIGQLAAAERLIAEGAAAVGVAGVAHGRVPLAGRRTAVVLTGANIDLDKLRQLI